MVKFESLARGVGEVWLRRLGASSDALICKYRFRRIPDPIEISINLVCASTGDSELILARDVHYLEF